MLKVSEETRKGLRRKYDDQVIHGHPLAGGESFTHNIRLIKSDFAILNTTYYALHTRHKEIDPRSYYENKLMNQILSENDHHQESDTISNLSYSQYSADDYFDDRTVNSEDNDQSLQLVSPISKNNRFNRAEEISYEDTTTSASVSSNMQDNTRKRLDSRVERALKQPDALKSPGESMIALHQQLEAMSKKASKFVKTEIETKSLIEKGLYVPKDTVTRSKADIMDPIAVERKMKAFKAADELMFNAILHRERDSQQQKVTDLFQQLK
jgi:hypothetical protein